MAHKKLTSEPTSSSPIITTIECNRALQFFQDGNHSEALKLARSTVSRHPNSALAHTTLAAILFSTAKSSKARKREHVASAVHSAERAVALSPNSISFSLFQAALLFELAQEDAASDYEPVIKECERALCIEKPLDPLEDHLDIDENDPEDFTVELRIGRVKRNLKELLKKAKIQQLKKVVDDNSFAEISKDIQAIQDRKAEIQTKFFTAKLSFERKLNSKVDTRAKDYWNNVMSLEAKKELLSVGFEDLNAHFNKNKSLAAKAKEVLAEAMECLKLTKNWKFSECCHCGERFFNWESHKEHVESVHLGTLSEELQLVVQERMRSNLLHETIILDGWKPVDMVACCEIDGRFSKKWHHSLNTSTNSWRKIFDIPCGFSLYKSLEADEARGDLKSSYERIFISNNFSRLVFNERMLYGLILPGIDETGNVDESKNDGKEDIEAILHCFGKCAERRRNLLGYQKSWHNLKDICCEEEKRRNEILGYDPQSYKSLLLKRKKEIEAEKGDEEMDSFGLELDNISCILKKAEADSDKELFIMMQIYQTTVKLVKLDAIIMMINTSMQHTWKKLEMVTTYDYRSIVVPLLKSFMQAQLEEMVDKDAAEKSNAAVEALLSELALNEKNIEKGGNDARKGQGKLKDKKKKKNHKKAKEFKVTGGPITTDELETEELELKAEEEYRMLEMNLELQMRIEYEAKQKRLAELNKAETSAGNVTEDVPSNGINFVTFDWTNYYQDQGVRSDEKSSEPEQQKHPKAPEDD
uniref:C2H2-type domain-containing protein n=1 Tax=Fagus sylvatica TaxID=28930 RepID=A0A2N9EWD4_FAGSY